MAFIALMAALAARALTIDVAPVSGDATETLRRALAEAASHAGQPVTIRLSPADYHLSRNEASRRVIHISNTASEQENPDPTKHVGLLLEDLCGVTVDGCGARLVTHGEMTAFAIERCSGITLKNFTLTAADPTVVEIRVMAADSVSADFSVTQPTEFSITSPGRLRFAGEGWTLGDGAIAQVFHADRNVTLRCDSPLNGYRRATATGPCTVRLDYDRVPDVRPGEVYQLRHAIRNEVCGFINRSRDVALENIDINFTGNFGIVGQMSENLTFERLRFSPDTVAGRTCAGFADFIQMSGCSGKVRVTDSHFEGSQDDPINIHGTHLLVEQADSARLLTVRYMHPQTFGFAPCEPGDSIEIVDRMTLLPVACGRVEAVEQIDSYRYRLDTGSCRLQLPADGDIGRYAVENITRTPEVEITGNFFARTPTRGILLTTRRRSLIAGNTFFRIPMAAILVSDDARSWWESGPVHDLTIRDNRFVECQAPVIEVKPETSAGGIAVHRNITIENNMFERCGESAISVDGAENVTVRGNLFSGRD